MSNIEADQTESTELWHVQLRTGEVRLWSLDQLDAAFQAEIVDGATNVLQDGTMDWVTLGQLLGLDGEAPEAPAAAEEVQALAPAPVAAAPFVPFAAPMEAVSPTPAPVALDAFEERPGNSVRPVVADVGDDLDLEAMGARPRKRGLVGGLVAAALALGGGIFAVTHFSAATASAAPSVAAVAAGLPPIVPETAPPPQPVAAAPIAPVAAAAADSPATSSDARLNDVQKKKLLESDKSKEAMRKSRAAAPSRGHSAAAKEKPVFHKGGDKYDPLNSSL